MPIDDALKRALKTALNPAPEPTRTPTLKRMSDYANGDQWGKGAYWRGRVPKVTAKPDANATDLAAAGLADVEKLFVQDDQVGPALDRVTSAMLGRDPDWTCTDPDASEPNEGAPRDPTELEAEVTAALLAWHRDARVWDQLTRAARFVQWAGRASLRVYVPADLTDQAASATTLADALELVHVMAHDATRSGVIRDEHGRDLAHYYRYAADTGDGKTENRVEVYTRDEVLTVREQDLSLVTDPAPNPLADLARPHRPRFQMRALERRGGSVLTQSVIDAQDALNEAWTNLKRNDQLAGYRSLVLTNAEQPEDATTGKPIPWTFGPSIVAHVNGIPTAGSDAMPDAIATPGVIVVDPVDPARYSIPTIDKLTDALLARFDQLWTVMASERVSGESKKQSRKAFDNRVMLDALPVVDALEWALWTALALAARITNRSADLARLRFTGKLYLDVSRGDLEVFKALYPAHERNLVSLDTLVSANPAVSDVDAELARLTAPARLTPQAAATAVAAGSLSLHRALIAQGYDDATATAIVAERAEEAQHLAAGTAPPGGAA